MPKFSVNTHRFDPYRNFRFHVIVGELSGDPVAGLSRVSELKKTTKVVDWNEGGEPYGRKLPGKTSFEPITLERGLTLDPAFEAWANLVNSYQADGATSLLSFRKDVLIVVHNLQGDPVLRYHVYRCWVSEYTALPELDASADAVAIQKIVLQNEGWERDLSLSEPAET